MNKKQASLRESLSVSRNSAKSKSFAIKKGMHPKKMVLVTFKFVDTHPRVNRLANTFKECGYEVTIYGLSRNPENYTNSNDIKFITFPMRNTVRANFTDLILLPMRFVIGSFAALTLIYCWIRKI